jgi:hypothetical protein
MAKGLTMSRNKVRTSEVEVEEEEMRGMRSNASHIFIISPENVTIREEVIILFFKNDLFSVIRPK